MKISRQATIGISLALTTAIMWGVVPIAVKQVIDVMPPETLVWYRFFIAGLGLWIFLGVRRQLPSLRLFRHRRWMILLIIAVLGLGGNFVLFSYSLKYLSPTAIQVITQLSPIGLMLASVWVLKEPIRGTQIIGAIMLVVGLVLFFNTNLAEIFTQMGNYTVGVLMGIGASVVWVSYGLAQKILLRRLASQQILFLLYVLCAVLLLPIAQPQIILQLNGWQVGCLIFCGVNTLIAYGALAEAMARWQASQVSALITLTPLFTLLFSDLLALGWPEIFQMAVLNMLGYFGAFIVVAGAMFFAVGHHIFFRRNTADTEQKQAIPSPNERITETVDEIR